MGGMTLGRRAGLGALAAALMLILAGCMLLPGRFTSSLDIRKDGTFTYGYTGDIHMLMLSEFADMGNAAATAPFKPAPCHGGNHEEKACTAAELDTQEKDWEAARARTEERRKRDGESMKAVFGGIDPTDPGAAEELAQRLRQQTGWKAVEHKGDGLFRVDFSITGTLDRDFAFPTIERMAMVMPFVQISRRQDGTVRVEAPGFAPAQPGTPYAEMMQEAASSAKRKDKESIPTIDGSFTLTTDGEILENNTGEGPKADPARRSLSWTVTAHTPAAPMAVIKLAPTPAAP